MSLPSGYRRLEYIQSSGTQYIDTGFKPSGEDMRVVFDFMYTAAHNNHSLYGVQTSSTEFSITAFNDPKFYVGTSWDLLPQTTSLNVRYLLDAHANNGTLTVSLDGTTRNSAYSGRLDKTLNLSLFGNNMNGSTVQLVSARLYSCQIYDNGTLVRDFIPCQTASGDIGLWDDVNSVFYGNAGTGTFTAGKVMPVAADESEIKKLKYIQSSGTQFIDTGFKPNQNTTIAAEFEVLDASNNGAYLYGGGTGTASFEAYPWDGQWDGKLEFNYGSVASFVGTIYANKRFYICQDKTKYTLSYFDGSGEWTGNHAEQSFTSAYTLAIFALNRGTVAYPTAGMKLYSCQIYDNGTLIRDYIPAKLDDGTVGLYDKLNGLLYINAGTGTFISGGYALNLPVNIGGTWKDANEAFVNIGGTWKTVEAAFVNIGGTWKELS